MGAIIASRHPRNAIGWLYCGVGVLVGLNSFAGDSAEYWLASGFGLSSLGETAKQGRVSVPEIVPPFVGQLCSREQGLEEPVDYFLGVDGSALARGEDQS